MSRAMAEPVPVNVLDVALRVVSEPGQPVFVSMVEAYALCLFVLQQNDMPEPAEPPVFLPELQFPASLAASGAQLLLAYEHRRQLLGEWWETNGIDRLEANMAVDAAFNDFKTRFEREFPNGSN